jgi:purine-binding chemotaxis protein CheW
MTEILDARQAPATSAGTAPATPVGPVPGGGSAAVSAAGAGHGPLPTDHRTDDVATTADDATTAGSDRYLTFSLGEEVFALPILDITEILEFRSLTVVPMMPGFIRGVINLRGRVVPVVDLAARFDRGTTRIARRTSIVIVETGAHGDDGDDAGGQDTGIIVDSVNKVVHFAADDIEPPPAFGAGIRADFISGMAKCDGEFIVVLDAARVLSLDEMAHLSRTAAAGRHQHRHQQNHDPASAGSGATAETATATAETATAETATANPTTAEAASA